ncbi:DUF732 domain-containing protein [Mycolicibacter arupensis]|jgi:hypothetical protein|uniref:DUF732 domain-containing protein n=1 Tax=Mycolicibacter arupensis TaxID=342002 RepID=A0A0F5N0X7_9MYCO|nr:DUF732 domain-containing protein [Mycolicibacter arupensis]KAA1430526.1 DUF732 domain-containing protein [Mycolicibacter arupensis]KKC00684.1 hypothetical protein WR43_03575 [Mycolicibacter arupensis]MCV7275346.1 DUF732 domain-containing protein [Mycolicibacter arupensis]ORA00460.1 hypothetical protein BST15_04450 [Mycolicibacter arupensis]TXI54151.1 MAG: DUF732 domain-containing protein [Mycolicibacter arupensis]
MKLSVVPAVIAAAIALAVPGHAYPGTLEPNEVDNAEFVSELHQVGISFADPNQAVEAAQVLCGLAANGEAGLELLTDITDANPALSVPDAARFAAMAAKTYCPQQLNKGGGGSK